MLCVATSAARPVASTSVASAPNTCAAVAGSRLPVGSSASRDAGTVGDGAGDRHALLLAPRQLRRPVVAACGEAEVIEQLARPPLGLALAETGDQLRHDDVFPAP